MNLIETYLIKTHEVTPYISKCTVLINRDFVKVIATWNCYGIVEKRTDVFEVAEWEEIKEKGYYLG